MAQYREEHYHRVVNRAVGPDCVLDLRFNEGTGTTIRDWSGYGNDATLTLSSGQSESSFWTLGKLGYAGGFNDGDYVTVPDDSSLQLGTEFTIEAIVQSDWESQSGNTWLFDKTDAWEVYYRTQSQSLNAGGTWNVSNDGTQTHLDDGKTIHFVIRRYDGVWEMFFDGVAGGRAEGDANTSAATSTGDLIVGAKQTKNDTVNGQYHAFRIFNRALGDDEILGAGSTPYQQGLLKKRTEWMDESDTKQAAIDPDRGTQKLPLQSTPPSNPEIGESYYDDGTNTSSGNVAERIWDGSSWVDQN